jgi:hypothetical protein
MIIFMCMAHLLPTLPAGSDLCIQHTSNIERAAMRDNSTIFVKLVALARHD